MKLHQPTQPQQVSVAKYLSGGAVDDRSGDVPTIDVQTWPESRADIDPTTEIYLLDQRYHRDRGGER